MPFLGISEEILSKTDCKYLNRQRSQISFGTKVNIYTRLGENLSRTDIYKIFTDGPPKHSILILPRNVHSKTVVIGIIRNVTRENKRKGFTQRN